MFKLKILSFLCFLVLISGGLGCEVEPSVDPNDLDDEELDDPTWTDDVQPILTAYCGGCHEGAATGSGIGWLNSYEEVTANAGALVCEGSDRADCIAVRLLDGSMPDGAPCPPGTAANCITDNQFATVENWLAADKLE